MTDTLERIARKLQSAADLREIVGAMRAMAAARLQEAQGALPGTRAYADTVGAALAEALTLAPVAAPAALRRPVLVAFMPEHGFVGALAERLVARVEQRRDAAAVIVVGDRGADVAEQHGVAVHARFALGAHIDAAPAAARRLAAALEPLLADGRADSADLLFARHAGAGQAPLVERRLLPLDPVALPAAVRTPPLVNLAPDALVDAIAAQWVLGELAHAVVETLASENGARLVAMDAARGNVDGKLAALQGQYRSARQEAITAEIAEVVGGVLAQEQPLGDSGAAH